MKKKHRYIIMAIIIITGAFMTSLLASYKLHSLFLDGSFFSLIYRIIHFPAEYIANFWVFLGLPPHGDAAIVFVPPIAVGLQWLILLLLFILITAKVDFKKPNFQTKLKNLEENNSLKDKKKKD